MGGGSLLFMAWCATLFGYGTWSVLLSRYPAGLVAPFARLLRIPLVVDVDSSIPDQLRYSGFATRGPLVWLADSLEGHALRHAGAHEIALTVEPESGP